MDVQTVDISEAKANLSVLIEKVKKGKEIIIEVEGTPVAKLVPYQADHKPRQLGIGYWAGKIKISDQFDNTSSQSLMDRSH
ncbi:MAG: type II toxin-antitoxin system prevent-host-death family antitoxin [Chloroflexota bacterium]